MKLFYSFVLLSLSSLSASPAIALNSQLLFESELEAVRAASDHYNPLSIYEDREYMGTIYRSGGSYGYTVSAGRARSNRIDISVPVTDWDNVVAFWHTHGDDAPNHRYFSDADTSMVNQFGKPFYLADYTGFLKVFSQGSNTLSSLAAAKLAAAHERRFCSW